MNPIILAASEGVRVGVTLPLFFNDKAFFSLYCMCEYWQSFALVFWIVEN
jgi:hypothetical protein